MIRTSAVVTRELELALPADRERGGHEVAQRMVIGVYRLCVLRARKLVAYYHTRGEIDDAIQAGVLGALRATTDYDPDRGPFKTYATWWIDAYIEREICAGGRCRLPVGLRHGDASLDAPMKRLDGVVLCDRFGIDPWVEVEERLHAPYVRARVQAAVDALPPRERRVIDGVLEGRPLRECGESSRQRAMQLKNKGMNLLRASLTLEP